MARTGPTTTCRDVSMQVMMLDLVDLMGRVLSMLWLPKRHGGCGTEGSGDKTQTWSSTHCDDESSIEIGTTVKSVTAGDLDGDGAPGVVISCEDATDEKLRSQKGPVAAGT